VRRTGGARAQPDFGTYHHSTPGASERIRERAKVQFSEGFASLPFSRDDPLKILDIGCGLGFLSCVSAEYYPNALVTGFDRFEHPSLKGSSLARAKENAGILGLSAKVKFEKGEVLASNYGGRRFALFVSNLVYHNLGRKRHEAYGRLARWASPGSYALIGDIFFNYKEDSKRLRGLFESVEARPRAKGDGEYRILILSRPR
jgi:cyclopropane fatty-acyl-phospholipid synthase-like methyltransferase